MSSRRPLRRTFSDDLLLARLGLRPDIGSAKSPREVPGRDRQSRRHTDTRSRGIWDESPGRTSCDRHRGRVRPPAHGIVQAKLCFSCAKHKEPTKNKRGLLFCAPSLRNPKQRTEVPRPNERLKIRGTRRRFDHLKEPPLSASTLAPACRARGSCDRCPSGALFARTPVARLCFVRAWSLEPVS